jgi:RNA polymerase sigma-70 factor (ECF subfamily)
MFPAGVHANRDERSNRLAKQFLRKARGVRRPLPSLEVMDQPADADWDWERILPWLRVQARKFHLQARFQPRFDQSDLVQATLVRALEKMDQLKNHAPETMMRWLQEILHNVTIDRIDYETAEKRDVRREKELRDAIDQSTRHIQRIFDPHQSSPSERAEKAERELRLAAAVERLPDIERDVVILFHYTEKSLAAIAEQLGRTERAVQGILDRGRKKLRAMLKNDGL